MTWKPTYTIALIPIGGAILISLALVPFTSANTAQLAAVIWFFLSLPFVVSRLIDRAR